MIVLLKAVLANVTAIITQPVNNVPQSAIVPSYRPGANLRNGQPGHQQSDPANVPLPNTIDPSELPIEEVEALRSREITGKAVSGILLVLLKWFKVSRACCLYENSHLLILPRHSKIRVSNAASLGFELFAFGTEVVRTPGD